MSPSKQQHIILWQGLMWDLKTQNDVVKQFWPPSLKDGLDFMKACLAVILDLSTSCLVSPGKCIVWSLVKKLITTMLNKTGGKL